MIPKFLFILSVFANLFCKAIQPESYSKNEVSECTCGDSQPDPANTLPWTYICIIGNSQHSNNALRSHKMWGGAFPSFWFVWGKDDTPIEPVAGLHILKSNQTKTWAEGIEFLLGHARELFDCEYFFTHDDDLQFRLKNQTDARSLETVLTDLMLEYQPAVAGFPWEFGDKTYSGMKSQKAVNENTRVNVLTGFDSGMIIYHTSIVDFFIPYSPRGEGGFFGSWSLCAHFITLFAPLTFKGAAIRLNEIQYDNLVSISNVPIKQRKNRNGKLNKDGLVIQAESRHPYEYNKNKPYVQFLASGMLNPHQRFGRELLQQDVSWEPESAKESATLQDIKLGRKSHRKYNRVHVLHRISEFYDLSHQILSNNTWIRQKFTERDLAGFKCFRYEKGLDYSFIIHFFTNLEDMNGFLEQWRSLNEANTITNQVNIRIHVENREQLVAADFESRLRRIRALASHHGPVSIRLNTKRKGELQSILDAWFPNSQSEYGIFILSGTSHLSPNVLEYAQQMSFRYLHGNHQHNHLMGASLHPVKRSELGGVLQNTPWPERSPFLLQFPPALGMILRPNQWTDFITWFHSLSIDFDPMIYDSEVNLWDSTTRWDKFLARYLVEFGNAFIYPNLPLSLISNSRKSILNPSKRRNTLSEDKQPLRLVYVQNSTMDTTCLISAPKLPDLADLAIFNHQGKKVNKWNSLNLSKRLHQMDKCTLSLHIRDRTQIAWRRIDHYQSHPLVDAINVIWDSPENSTYLIPLTTPEGNSTTMIPIHISHPEKEGHFNRFRPIKELKSFCVISLDEDTNVFHDDLTNAVRLFQQSNYLQIIQIKGYERGLKDQKFRGGVFHSRYLDAFDKLIRNTTVENEKADSLFEQMVHNLSNNASAIIYKANQHLNLFASDDAWMFDGKVIQ